MKRLSMTAFVPLLLLAALLLLHPQTARADQAYGYLLPDSSYIYPGRFLLQGSRGDDVTELQRLLNRAAEKNSYIPAVTVDGNFGAATEAAVRMVQQSRGLEVNGIVGPATWDAVVQLAQSV